MKDLIEDFPDQILRAKNIGEQVRLSPKDSPIHTVVIAGLGGSGIGGTIVADLARTTALCPIVVSKNYSVPAFVNENTLAIVSSYSGTTEETVQFLKEAITRNAKIVCITTGGEIARIANENKLDCVTIPAGSPPRAGLGYSLIQTLYILNHYGIIDASFKKDIDVAAELLKQEQKHICSLAEKIAGTLVGKLPVIYTPFGFGGVATRFRQQLNENAKTLAWTGVVPEMNHNELVAWSKKYDALAIIFFRNSFEHERISRRIEITKEQIAGHASLCSEIKALGTTFFQQTLYQIHVGDWISYFLAEKMGVDAMEVDAVERLKHSMNEAH